MVIMQALPKCFVSESEENFMKKGKRKWLTGVVAALAAVTAVADSGVMGADARALVRPAVDLLLGLVQSSGS